MRVLVSWDVLPGEREAISELWPREASIIWGADLDAAEADGVFAAIDVLVGYARTLPVDRLYDARSLKLIQVFGHGIDSLRLSPQLEQVLTGRGVSIATTNHGGHAIAEYVAMSLMALNRRLLPLHRDLAGSGRWPNAPWLPQTQPAAVELAGSTTLLIGYGNIGREVHRLLAALGSRVGAVVREPHRHASAGLDFLVSWGELHKSLGACDNIVIAVPLTTETAKLVDAEAVSCMKCGVNLVNVSRGAIVDEDALWEGLNTGRIGGVALDVFETEWSGYPTSRPLQHFNAILTPHCSSKTAETRRRALQTIGENLRSLLDGRPLRNVVLPKASMHRAGDS